MKGVILSIKFDVKSLAFQPLLNLVRAGDFSTIGLTSFLSLISLVHVGFFTILVVMQ